MKNLYTIKSVLGSGGFGITYLAATGIPDSHLVAIKEYFPSGIAYRKNTDDYELSAYSQKEGDYFSKGYQRIMKEGEIIRHFKNLESIVTLYEIIEANNTVYLVMEYIEGITLHEYVQTNGILSFPELFTLISPVMKDLSFIHAQGLIHRDITPDNLMISTENKLRLIDFGSYGDKNFDKKIKTVILRTGYAPPEQYLANGKLGPWTDVYAMCATICFALTGVSPSDALTRTDDDLSFDLKKLSTIEPPVKNALRKGMMLHIADRFSDIKELYAALSGTDFPEDRKTMLVSAAPKADTYTLRVKKGKRYLFSAICIGIAASAAAILLMNRYRKNNAVFERAALHASEKPVSSAKNDTGNSPALSMPSNAAPDTSEKVETKETANVKLTSEIPVGNGSSKILYMPDLKGKTLKNAKKTIRKLDSSIKITTTWKSHKTVKRGRILSQSIPENTSFTKKQIDTLLLVISSGKKETVKKTTPPPGTHTKNPVQKNTATPKKDANTKKKSKEEPFSISTQKPYSNITLD